MIPLILAAAAGLAVGTFCPSIARKIKASFTKEEGVIIADVKADEQKIARKL